MPEDAINTWIESELLSGLLLVRSVGCEDWIADWRCVQFGHLFAKGETREAAIRAMVVALKEIKIRGEIRTIVDYAIEMVQSPDFVNNEINTGWLDSRIASQVSSTSLLSSPSPSPSVAMSSL